MCVRVVSLSHVVSYAVMLLALAGGVYPDIAVRWSAFSVALRSRLNSNVLSISVSSARR